jgi:hypothetical protein
MHTQVTGKTDVHALGVMIMSCFNKEQPYTDLLLLNEHEFIKSKVEGTLPPLILESEVEEILGPYASSMLNELVRACTRHSPFDRPDAQDVLEKLDIIQERYADHISNSISIC